MSSNKFKAVPLVLFVLLSAMVLCLWQGLWGDFHEYVIWFKDDNFTQHGGWALYALLIPAVAGLCAYPRKENVYFYLGSLAIPVLLCISYWLWELLGWALILGGTIAIWWYINEATKDSKLDSVYLYMSWGYLAVRIICSFISENWRNIADICYVALLSLTQLYFILRTYFSYPHEDSTTINLGFEQESHYCNSTGFYNGLSIIALTIILASGALSWKKAASIMAIQEEVTIEETTLPTDSSKLAAKKTAKSDHKTSSTSSSGSSTTTTKPPKTPPPSVPNPKQEPTPVPQKVHPFQGYKTSADAGDAAAMYHTAKCYQQGDGVGKSLSLAFNYMYQAAQAGYVPAYFEVAEMFHGGRGTQKDRDKAEFWYKKAADNGNTKARQILNNM